MPYQTPSASAYTAAKKVFATHQSNSVLNSNKLKLQLPYTYYIPTRDQLLLGNGVESNKFIPPKFITDGLVLYYNAGESSSYPGTGNLIYDLSPTKLTYGGIYGPTFSSSSGGVFNFDGVNDYILAERINQGSIEGFLYSENFTVNCWFKTTDATNANMLVSKQPRDPDRWNYRMFLTSGGFLAGDTKPFMEWDAAISYGGKSLADGKWHLGTFMRDTSKGLYTLFVDGDLAISAAYPQTTAPITDVEPVMIGRTAWQSASFPFSGSIGSVFIYHRPLTNAEVKINFDRTKTRFRVD